MFNCLFRTKNKKINSNNPNNSNNSNNLNNPNNPNNLNNPNNPNNPTLNILFDSCINLYDPINDNCKEVQIKFITEYANIFHNTNNLFDDTQNYIINKQILLDKMTEKKKESKLILFKYYCVCMTIFETIKIIKVEKKYEIIKYNKDILYYFEYLDINKFTIDEIISKYKKLFNCKIE